MNSSTPSPQVETVSIPTPAFGLPIAQPIKTLFRNIKFELGFFNVLTSAATNFGTQNHLGLASNAIEALNVIKIDKLDAAERAWLLIYRAMLRGAAELIEPSVRLLDPEESTKDALAVNLDATLENRKVTITKEFFRRPQDLPILTDFGELLNQWLTGWGLEASRARTVVDRLPIFFVVALHEEWRQSSSDYAPIVAEFDTPFIAATEELLEWDRYYALLRKQVQEAMFEESFSLQQVYVPLRAYYEEEKEKKPREAQPEPFGREGNKTLIVVDLQASLNSWLKGRDRTDALRVVSGGPGSGKSSFAKMWAAELAEQATVRVLFVPLHRFDLKRTLEEAVGEFVRQSKLLPTNPLDAENGQDHLLLIFDGLDEIAERGKASTIVAQQFVAEVEKTITQRNHSDCRVQAIITGRDVSVQSNATHFRKRGQILHALPYIVENDPDDPDYQDEQNLLKADQRDEWWAKYGAVTGRPHEALPESLSREDLEEVTAQPLLNYLVALSFERGKINFSQEGINLNEIYEDLLMGVHERGYENKRQQIPELKSSEFARALEEIALAVWHGNGRTTTVSEIESHCKRSGSDTLLKKFEEGAQTGVTRLLTAFYFREHGQDSSGDRTFEFTHKSFGEYLTAKRIVRALEKIAKKLEERRDSFDEGWTERQALLEWADVCGFSGIDEYIHKFLKLEIDLFPIEKVQKWQQEIGVLINATVKNGMPMESLENKLSFKEMMRQSSNAEIALLTTHRICADQTKVVTKIDWPTERSARNLINRLRDHNWELTQNLAFLNFENCDFFYVNLMWTNVRGCNFKDAHLILSQLTGADFRGASLSGAHLGSSAMEFVNFEDANLENATFFPINFPFAKHDGDLFTKKSSMNYSNFKNANLEGANLYGVDLIGVDFTGANLLNVKLGSTDLTHANFEGVDLKGADFTGAKLSHTNFHNANMSGVIGFQYDLPFDSDEESEEISNAESARTTG